jgi:hypothetical protein
MNINPRIVVPDNITGLQGRVPLPSPAYNPFTDPFSDMYRPNQKPIQAGENKGLYGINNTLVQATDKTIPDWIGEIITNHQQNNAQVRSNKMLYYIIGAVVIIALGMLILMPSKRSTKKFK